MLDLKISIRRIQRLPAALTVHKSSRGGFRRPNGWKRILRHLDAVEVDVEVEVMIHPEVEAEVDAVVGG